MHATAPSVSDKPEPQLVQSPADAEPATAPALSATQQFLARALAGMRRMDTDEAYRLEIARRLT